MLSPFTIKQLKSLVHGMSDFVVGADQAVKDFLAKYPANAKNRLFAQECLLRRSQSTNQHKDPIASINIAGGALISDGKEIYQTNQQVRSHTVVPTNGIVGDTYTSQHALSVFYSQLLVVDGGEFKPVTSSTVFQKIFNLDAGSVMSCAQTLVSELNLESNWTSKTLLERNGVSGISLPIYVHGFFGRCTPSVYAYYENLMVVYGLQAYVKDSTGAWVDSQNGAAQCARSLTEQEYVRASGDRVMAAMGTSDLFAVDKGFRPKISVPDITNAAQMVKTCQEVISFGGSSSTVSLLNGMRGNSFFMTETGKRMVFLVSTTAAVLHQGSTACIKINSIGDIPIIISSLRRLADMKVFVDDGSLFTFHVPNTDDIQKVSMIYSHLCSTVRKSGAVYVAWSESLFPSSAKKGDTIDYELAATRLVSSDMREGSVVVSTKVWGTCFWKAQPSANSTIPPIETIPCQIHQYGDMSEGRGIFSTYQRFAMMGLRVDKKWSVLTPELVQCPVVASVNEWYGLVRAAIGQRYLFWLDPRVFRSTTANVLYQTKTNATLVHAQFFTDSDGVAGPVRAAPSLVAGSAAPRMPTRAKPSVPATTTTTTTTVTTTTTSTAPTHPPQLSKRAAKKADWQKKAVDENSSKSVPEKLEVAPLPTFVPFAPPPPSVSPTAHQQPQPQQQSQPQLSDGDEPAVEFN